MTNRVVAKNRDIIDDEQELRHLDALTRSHSISAEYCDVLDKAVLQVEKVQRKATKLFVQVSSANTRNRTELMHLLEQINDLAGIIKGDMTGNLTEGK